MCHDLHPQLEIISHFYNKVATDTVCVTVNYDLNLQLPLALLTFYSER